MVLCMEHNLFKKSPLYKKTIDQEGDGDIQLKLISKIFSLLYDLCCHFRCGISYIFVYIGYMQFHNHVCYYNIEVMKLNFYYFLKTLENKQEVSCDKGEC